MRVFVRQDNEEAEEAIPDEFYWSVESDHEVDHESGQDGQGSGVVEGIETGQESGVVEGIKIGSYERSTDDDDAVTKFSKHMNGQQFTYGDNEKIHFKVGQMFEGVDHFRKLSRSKLYRANKLAKGRSDKLHAESFAGFAAQKKGFIEGCRHFIGVDGCHLKGPYGGVLLSAVSMDANSGIFLVAIIICEIENKESWRYFITLKKFLGLRLRNLFWAVSRAANIIDFQQAMEKVEAIDKETHSYLAWGDEFEVVDNNCLPSRRYILNLQSQTCDCGMWQLSGVPCVHAVRYFLFRSIRNMEDYVDSSLRITSYVKTYADHIHPILDPLS
ncbi:hypothetical protein Pint_23438 [Pistacia integerrima]|uniref:Uncharacterized protein n=1 Tax=Pistacia integerrima TaxID=434235 RepID=A0ACC0YKE7_9ROSI|nr:hypothetical protein Pint_23438 [Pistacia integerrima]